MVTALGSPLETKKTQNETSKYLEHPKYREDICYVEGPPSFESTQGLANRSVLDTHFRCRWTVAE